MEQVANPMSPWRAGFIRSLEDSYNSMDNAFLDQSMNMSATDPKDDSSLHVTTHAIHRTVSTVVLDFLDSRGSLEPLDFTRGTARSSYRRHQKEDSRYTSFQPSVYSDHTEASIQPSDYTIDTDCSVLQPSVCKKNRRRSKKISSRHLPSVSQCTSFQPSVYSNHSDSRSIQPSDYTVDTDCSIQPSDYTQYTEASINSTQAAKRSKLRRQYRETSIVLHHQMSIQEEHQMSSCNLSNCSALNSRTSNHCNNTENLENSNISDTTVADSTLTSSMLGDRSMGVGEEFDGVPLGPRPQCIGQELPVISEARPQCQGCELTPQKEFPKQRKHNSLKFKTKSIARKLKNFSAKFHCDSSLQTLALL